MNNLKPFWRYYGGKYRVAPHYPCPRFDTIIEPFAGAAGYACRYYQKRVILIEKYPVVANLWKYLIRVDRAEILRIPLVEARVDLPSWVPEEASCLVGFWLNNAIVSPRQTLSAGKRKLATMGRNFEGWNEASRNRIAQQVEMISHWQVIEGDYTLAPDLEATWFIDPPYNNKAGAHYIHSDIDYEHLGAWCQTRKGQVMVCENDGAGWLPFKSFRRIKAGPNNQTGSAEALWTNGSDDHGILEIFGG